MGRAWGRAPLTNFMAAAELSRPFHMTYAHVAAHAREMPAPQWIYTLSPAARPRSTKRTMAGNAAQRRARGSSRTTTWRWSVTKAPSLRGSSAVTRDTTRAIFLALSAAQSSLSAAQPPQ